MGMELKRTGAGSKIASPVVPVTPSSPISRWTTGERGQNLSQFVATTRAKEPQRGRVFSRVFVSVYAQSRKTELWFHQSRQRYQCKLSGSGTCDPKRARIYPILCGESHGICWGDLAQPPAKTKQLRERELRSLVLQSSRSGTNFGEINGGGVR